MSPPSATYKLTESEHDTRDHTGVPGVGLPTGWTQDINDPANVASGGSGGLDLGTGNLNAGGGVFDGGLIAYGGFSTDGANGDMGTTGKIINMADPVTDQGAATKKYVDDNGGFTGWTQDVADPANIDTHGGSIDQTDVALGRSTILGSGSLFVQGAAEVYATFSATGTEEMLSLKPAAATGVGIRINAANGPESVINPNGVALLTAASRLANVTAIAHAGGVGAATLDDVKVVADKVDELIAGLVSLGIMTAP